MKTSQTFSIHFWLKKTARKNNGNVPIYVRITVDGIRADLSIKRTIREEHWSHGVGRLNPRTSGARNINEYLEEVRSKLTDCHKQLHSENALITARAIKLRYLGKDKAVNTLKELIGYHRKNGIQKLEPGTTKNYSATEKYLERFLKESYMVADIKIGSIDYSFLMEFEGFLRSCHPLRKSQPLSNNGIMKHMERFQKLMNIALKFGWAKHNPFALYQLKFEEYDSDFLEQHEIILLQSLAIKEPGIRLVRDLFIFACYTGLSYIEVKSLKNGDIVKGVDGNDWISVKRKKTGTPVKVPLLDEARNILNRYADHPHPINGHSLLPVFSNQKVNQYLKNIACKAGINKHLTFHVARHTFATTVTLLNDVPLETVSKLLGHTKLSTTQRYARVVEQKISKDMVNLKKILASNSKKEYNYQQTSHGHLKVVK